MQMLRSISLFGAKWLLTATSAGCGASLIQRGLSIAASSAAHSSIRRKLCYPLEVPNLAGWLAKLGILFRWLLSGSERALL